MKLSSPLYSAAGMVASTTGDRAFVSTTLSAFASDTFTLGVVTSTTGANTGRKAEVAAFAGGIVTLFKAPVRQIYPGDGFVATAGCDKQFPTCRTKFAKWLKFRGSPHMPGQKAVLRYPNSGEANDGAPLSQRT